MNFTFDKRHLIAVIDGGGVNRTDAPLWSYLRAPPPPHQKKDPVKALQAATSVRWITRTIWALKLLIKKEKFKNLKVRVSSNSVTCRIEFKNFIIWTWNFSSERKSNLILSNFNVCTYCVLCYKQDYKSFERAWKTIAKNDFIE